MNIDVVVARFKEEPSSMMWLHSVPKSFRVHIMDAGTALGDIDAERESKVSALWHHEFKDLSRSGRLFAYPVPNAGGEAGAYLHWIIEWRNHIAEYTVFTQADPCPHMRLDRDFPTTLFELASGKIPLDTYMPLAALDRSEWGSGMSKRANRMERRKEIHYGEFPLHYFRERFLPRMGAFTAWPVSNGAIFGAPRDAIWWHPKKWWEDVREWVCWAPTSYEVACMEKLWTPIMCAIIAETK